MSNGKSLLPPSRLSPETHMRGAEKLARIPVKVIPTETPLRKPSWIRVKAIASEHALQVKRLLRQSRLHTVCEEASCPNLNECFSHGTATFMILGDLCTRRCPFCDVAHGKPQPPHAEEPKLLAQGVKTLGLRYVVITSVNRDDLRDGGAGHFAACIEAVRHESPETGIEILTPDFRGRLAAALKSLMRAPPDVFNHNLETVPRLYRAVRPGAAYRASLELLRQVKERLPDVPTKSGLMLGVGEQFGEIVDVLRDLRSHGCEMLTLGQYLPPSRDHLPVQRFVTPEEFERLATVAAELGFTSVASAPLVRSSYHADQQAQVLFDSAPRL